MGKSPRLAVTRLTCHQQLQPGLQDGKNAPGLTRHKYWGHMGVKRASATRDIAVSGFHDTGLVSVKDIVPQADY